MRKTMRNMQNHDNYNTNKYKQVTGIMLTTQERKAPYFA